MARVVRKARWLKSLKLWSAITAIALAAALVLTFLPMQVSVNTDGLLSINLSQVSANPGIGDYYYKKALTFNTTGISVTSNQTNFPICVHINTSSWPTQSERDAFFDTNTNGKRVKFYDSDETTVLDYEVEYFSNVQASEQAIYWVEAPQVDGSSTTDHIHVGYGNDPNGTDQDNPTGVWDSNFKAVYHMKDGIWLRQGNCLAASSYEPSVIYEGNPQILTGETNVFKMWYTNGWASPAINYAESTDGLNWTNYGSNPVIASGRCPYVFKNGSTYYMFLAPTTLATINRYHSSDGVSWTSDGAVLPKGSAGQWDDSALVNSYVWIEGSSDWKMLYEAARSSAIWKIGLATSSDGLSWTKSGSNPVITETGACGGPWVTKVGTYYYCWLHHAPTGGLPTDLYRMRSTDLTTWADYPDAIVFARRTADEGVGASYGQVADPAYLEYNNKVYMWYAASADGTQESGNMHIKLAIADITISGLVTTSEGDYSSIQDSTSNRNDGTKGTAGEPTEVDANIGKGQNFDGGDQVNCGTGASLNITTAITIGAWVKIPITTGQEFIIQKYAATADYHGYGYRFGATGKPKAYTDESGDGWHEANTEVDDDTWRYIGFTSQSGSGVHYLNGVPDGTFAPVAAIQSNSAEVLWLGANEGSATKLIGSLDEIRISNSIRAADWIKLEYYSMKKTNFNGDSWLSWGVQETAVPTITNSPDSNGFGVLAASATANTAINYFTITNTGGCAVDVTIQGTDLAGGDDTWDLADDATPGENIYGLYAGKDDADDLFDVIVRETATYNTLVSALAESATQGWGLKIYMPTSLSGYDSNQMSGNITLVASEAA